MAERRPGRDQWLTATADGTSSAEAFYGIPVALYGAADGVAMTESRWVADLVATADGESGTDADLVAIRALEGWSGGWSLADLRVEAAKRVTVLAYGLPYETDETPRQTLPMCLRHEQDAIDKGVFVYSESLGLASGPCWVCNPQYVDWTRVQAPSAIP